MAMLLLCLLLLACLTPVQAACGSEDLFLTANATVQSFTDRWTNVPNNAYACYTIDAGEGNLAMLRFPRLRLEKNADQIKVYEIQELGPPVVGKEFLKTYTGNRNNIDWVTSNYRYIHFTMKTDRQVNSNGFRAEFMAVPRTESPTSSPSGVPTTTPSPTNVPTLAPTTTTPTASPTTTATPTVSPTATITPTSYPTTTTSTPTVPPTTTATPTASPTTTTTPTAYPTTTTITPTSYPTTVSTTPTSSPTESPSAETLPLCPENWDWFAREAANQTVEIRCNEELTTEWPPQLQHITASTIVFHSPQGTRLVGSIPEYVWTSPSLEYLDLRDNSLGGSLPSNIAQMTSLKHLNLANCGITGSIPEEIGHLSQLTYLNLAGNVLKGSIPEAIGMLVKLEKLYISYTGITGSLPDTVQGAKALRTIEAEGNNLVGAIPADLGALRRLETISLANNGLTGGIPSALGAIRSLQNVDFSNNRLTGPLHPTIGNLLSMSEFDISGNRVTGTIPSVIGRWKNLKTIKLGTNAMTGEIPVEVFLSPKLQEVDLLPNHFSGAVPSFPSTVQVTDVVAEQVLSLPGEACSADAMCSSQNCFNGKCCTVYTGECLASTETSEVDDYTLVIITGCVIFGGTLLLFLLGKYMNQNYLVFAPLCIAVLDFTTDALFAVSLLQRSDEDPSLQTLALASFACIPVAMTINTIVTSMFIQRKLRTSPAFQEWCHRNFTSFSVIRIFSAIAVDLLRLMSSGLHDLEMFKAPLDAREERYVVSLGMMNALFEDLPQVVIVVLAGSRVGWTSLSLISVLVSGVSIFVAIVYRCGALQVYLAGKRNVGDKSAGGDSVVGDARINGNKFQTFEQETDSSNPSQIVVDVVNVDSEGVESPIDSRHIPGPELSMAQVLRKEEEGGPSVQELNDPPLSFARARSSSSDPGTPVAVS